MFCAGCSVICPLLPPHLNADSVHRTSAASAALYQPLKPALIVSQVSCRRPAPPPSGCGSVAGSEAEGGNPNPNPNPGRKPRKRMASRFDSQIDPNLSAEERRRARRMLSNRESARRSRSRKESYLQVTVHWCPCYSCTARLGGVMLSSLPQQHQPASHHCAVTVSQARRTTLRRHAS